MADNVYHGLGKVNVLINGGLDGNQACYLAYTSTGVVYLVTDNGYGLLELGPNPWDSVSNGQCTILRGTLNDGTFAENNGSMRIVHLKVQFNSNWTGAKTIYAALFGAGNFENENSGWQAIGTWMGSPSGGTVVTTGIQFGGGATQELLVRYLTPFPDDLLNGQVLLSSQPDSYLSSCQISWWPNRSLSVQGVAGTFDQGAGHSEYCAVAPGATLTRTAEGFDLRLKVTLSQQLLETFPNRDFYIATGAYTKNPFGGQPVRAVSRTPVDGDPDVSDELFVYNDSRWYFFTGYCFGCNVIGLGAGAGLNIRCTDPQFGAVPPTSLEPPPSSCGTPILYDGEVPRISVAMSAPATTPAGPSVVLINASVAGAPQWSVSFSVPLRIRAAASARFSVRMTFFIPPVWIWGPPWETCLSSSGIRQLTFKGDNRSVSSNSAAYRVISMATADVLSGALSGVLLDTGVSSAFAGEPPMNGSRIADWAYDGTLGDCALEHRRGKAPTDRLGMFGWSSGINKMQVEIAGAAASIFCAENASLASFTNALEGRRTAPALSTYGTDRVPHRNPFPSPSVPFCGAAESGFL